ncbi:MAG: hypothetical protein OEY97_08950 [Nitrospirota bacterium]|nr:hypothetical protein [Nitrospirota bacterium]
MIRIAIGALLLALFFSLPAPSLAGELDPAAVERLADRKGADPEAARAAARAVSEAVDANREAAGYDAALKALKKGDAERAIRALTDALEPLARKKKNPQAAQAARILLALARLTGDAPLERRAAEAAARHDPDHLAAQGTLAAVLVQQGDLVAAETAWRQVINHTPGDPAARRAALAPLIALLDERARVLKAAHAQGKLEHPYEMVERMNAVGELYGQIAEKIPAAGMHHRALQVLETLGDTGAQARQWELLGRFYEYFDEPFRAFAAYQKAAALFDQVGDARRAARIRNWMQEKRLLP